MRAFRRGDVAMDVSSGKVITIAEVYLSFVEKAEGGYETMLRYGGDDGLTYVSSSLKSMDKKERV